MFAASHDTGGGGSALPDNRSQINARWAQAWADEGVCQQSAQALATALMPLLSRGAAFQIELHGTLGAGKTTFTRHLLRAMGVEGRIKSPSYAVVEPYELPTMAAWHFDFYRFNDPQEWEDAGFRDIFAQGGLKVIEWPEKAAALLPPSDLCLTLACGPGETQRQAQWQAGTPRGQSMLSGLQTMAWPAPDTPTCGAAQASSPVDATGMSNTVGGV